MTKLNFEVGDKLKCKKDTDDFLCRFKKDSYYKIINKVSMVFIDGTDSYEYHILDDISHNTPFYFISNIEDVFDFKLFERKKKLERLQNTI